MPTMTMDDVYAAIEGSFPSAFSKYAGQTITLNPYQFGVDSEDDLPTDDARLEIHYYVDCGTCFQTHAPGDLHNGYVQCWSCGNLVRQKDAYARVNIAVPPLYDHPLHLEKREWVYILVDQGRFDVVGEMLRDEGFAAVADILDHWEDPS